MKPGLGNGTLVMTLCRNHWMPRRPASVLTAVGLTRVSIGPPINVMEIGTYGSSSASMTETAAMTGTAGWHTANT